MDVILGRDPVDTWKATIEQDFKNFLGLDFSDVLPRNASLEKFQREIDSEWWMKIQRADTWIKARFALHKTVEQYGRALFPGESEKMKQTRIRFNSLKLAFNRKSVMRFPIDKPTLPEDFQEAGQKLKEFVQKFVDSQ